MITIKNVCILFLAVICVITVSQQYAFASPPIISLDKSSYTTGDLIKISGTLSELEEGMPVLLQVRSPNDFAAVDQFVPSSKSFSKTIQAEGPKWSEPGTYTVRVAYLGEESEKSFQFSSIKDEDSTKDDAGGGEGDEKGEDDSKSTTQQQQSPPPSTTEDVPEEEETGNTPDLVPEKEKEEKTAKPIISIQGFPDPSKSPNHYYERYSKEKQYKEWFDSIFVGYTPAEVVGYPQTHIPGFPDPARAPQYYIDRYDNEPEYREWFDSQFPEKTIQEVVIPSDKVQNVMPEWIKITSKQWSSGEIQDQMFVSVIKHLIQNDVIQNKPDFVPNSSSSSSLQDGDEENSIPEWVKNNAGWWADGLITENDFLFGIEELLKQGIIKFS